MDLICNNHFNGHAGHQALRISMAPCCWFASCRTRKYTVVAPRTFTSSYGICSGKKELIKN